jgi:hypothetical protein
MAKNQKRLDTNQLSLFDLIRTFSEQKPASKPAGSFDIDRRLRAAISQALKQCPLSIYEVAAKMSALCGTEITGSMLYSWTAESKNQHRFPAIYLPAFCEVTGCSEPLKLLGNLMGVFIMPGPDALRSEIQRLDEEIGKKQAEKKKRLVFLKEMEAVR